MLRKTEVQMGLQINVMLSFYIFTVTSWLYNTSHQPELEHIAPRVAVSVWKLISKWAERLK